MRIHPLAPVLALDIDGTLGAYHQHFVWFARLYTQNPMLGAHWAPEFQGEFSDALGMDKHEYRDIKLAYRQGGMKRCLPLIDPETKMVVQYLRSLGVQVWITTTRPWNRLDNIDPDTQFWINRNVGQVDGVIYGEDKYLDLIDIVGQGRVLGVFDDLPENIERATDLGLDAIMARGPHNAWWSAPAEVTLATGISQASATMEQWIEDRKEQAA